MTEPEPKNGKAARTPRKPKLTEHELRERMERRQDQRFALVEQATSTAADLGYEMTQAHAAQIVAAGLRGWAPWVAKESVRLAGLTGTGTSGSKGKAKVGEGMAEWIDDAASDLESYPASPDSAVRLDPLQRGQLTGLTADQMRDARPIDHDAAARLRALTHGTQSAPQDLSALAYLNGDTDTLPPPGKDRCEEHGATDHHHAGTYVSTGGTYEINTGSYSPTDEISAMVIHEMDRDLAADGVNPDQLAIDTKRDQMTNPTPIVAALADPFSDPSTDVKPLTFAELSAPVPPDLRPDHRSRSQMNEHTECNLRYRIKRYHAGQDGTPAEIPAWWNVGGDSLHACVEHYENGTAGQFGKDGEFSAGMTWWHVFHAKISEVMTSTPGTPAPDQWRAANKGTENYVWWRENGVEMLKRYVAWRAELNLGATWIFDANGYRVTDWKTYVVSAPNTDNTGWTTHPAVELELNDLYQGTDDRPGGSQKMNWTGRLDLALYSATLDRILIIDFKTGKTMPALDQLGDYAHALIRQHRGGQAPGGGVWGAFFDARSGTLTEPVDLLAAFPYESVAYQYLAFDATETAQANSGLYPPRPNGFPYSPCGGCGVKRLCPIGSAK